MVVFIIGVILGSMMTALIMNLGIYDMIMGDIDISDERLKNHAIEMKINRIPDDLDDRKYLIFRVFHKENVNENAR